MATNAKEIISAHATHPGSVLKRELQARGIKQKDFAVTLGMPAPNLSELITGKRHITESIAMKLEEVLGIPFTTWMNLQNRYHYIIKRRQEIDTSEAIAVSEEQSLCSRFNLKELYRFFNIVETIVSKRIAKLKCYISIDLNEIQALEMNTIGYFKRSDRLKINDINMRTWLLLAHSEVSKCKIDTTYTPKLGMRAAKEIARLANEGTITIDKIQEVLNGCGIVYKHVHKLEETPIDAYSVMAGENPAIVVTYRYNDMDKLVFDILHEIGHILKHITMGKSFINIERDVYSESPEEKEADAFARDTLIAPDIWKSIMSTGTTSLSPQVIVHKIAKEGEKHGISPSVAVARYKHESQCYNIRSYRSPKIFS